MRVLRVNNVHEALPMAMAMTGELYERESRNGPVLVHPEPVTTVYYRPTQRVCFWPERDANPAFHLYEALWMLRGRNDVQPLLRYVKDFDRFSDDGATLYGAYGFRWRKAYEDDQLYTIARRLRHNHDDRRCVLAIWDGNYDLDRDTLDLPCNLTATFQITANGALDMTVFNRSNDVILGAYGANAVHFSFLQEYMARWIEVPVGIYRQISSNWHIYKNTQYLRVLPLRKHVFGNGFAQPAQIPDPYRDAEVISCDMPERLREESPDDFINRLDTAIDELLMHAETGFSLPRTGNDDEPWIEMCYAVLRAHDCWRRNAGPERYEMAFAALARVDPRLDWVVAMRQWLQRRHDKGAK